MSWGVKILILYLGFVALIVSMVAMSINQKVELVAPDYYAQELKYQDKIDGRNNYIQLDTQVICKVKGRSIEVAFPEEFTEANVMGTILIYRPSDSSLDIKTAIKINNEGVQSISSSNLKKGLYKIQVEWTMNGKRYFDEQNLFVN
jgi:hypothetical protein